MNIQEYATIAERIADFALSMRLSDVPSDVIEHG